MALVRTYTGDGTSAFLPNKALVNVSYGIMGLDGENVRAAFDVSNNRLTSEQVDLLADAMRKAAAFLPWCNSIDVVVTETGQRDFRVTDDTPPDTL